MSDRPTTLRVNVGETEVVVEIRPSRATTAQQNGAEWDVVSDQGATAAAPALELVPSTDPPPLHLLRRSRLASRRDWTPQRRLERAFELGQQDAESALEGRHQVSGGTFPLPTAVYVILYDPSGDWPRITRSRANYFRAVQSSTGVWRPNVVSRGFPSLVEAEAYCLGASCQLPNEEF